MNRLSLTLALALVSSSSLPLYSCAAVNFVDNVRQDTQVRRLNLWVLANEYRRLSVTELGVAMIAGAGKTVTFDITEVNSLDRRTKGARVDAWLVPSGPDWMMLREMAARGSEELLEHGGLKILRLGKFDRTELRLSFPRMPEGRFDLIMRFRLRANQADHLVVVHGIMDIIDGTGAVSSLCVLNQDELYARLEEIGAIERLE